MNVLYEFLSEDPIDNYITCLNYRVDKVVYFGYHDSVESKNTEVKSFFAKHCKETRPVFVVLSAHDYDSVYNTMRKEIEREMAEGSRMFFDVTGGDELLLVSFGKLSAEFDLPMHMFDVPNGKVIEFNSGLNVKPGITHIVERRKISYDLETHVEIYGGAVNHRLEKEENSLESWGGTDDLLAIYDVYFAHKEAWSALTNIFNSRMEYDGDRLVATRPAVQLSADLAGSKDLKLNEFDMIMKALSQKGVISYSITGRIYRIEFKDHQIRECLSSAGMILEQKILMDEMERSDHAAAGKYFDWDGKIHSQGDVYNEIDVVSLNGYVPTFISCKNGRLLKRKDGTARDAGYLHALYELDVVAARFGGRYVRKALVTWNDVTGAYLERAREMGIEIRSPKPLHE